MIVTLNFDMNYKGRKKDEFSYKKSKIYGSLLFFVLSLIIAIALLGDSKNNTLTLVGAICFFLVAIISLLAPIYFILFSTPFKGFSGTWNYVITCDGDIITYRVRGTYKGQSFEDGGSNFSFSTDKAFYIITGFTNVYYLPKSQISIDKRITLDNLVGKTKLDKKKNK